MMTSQKCPRCGVEIAATEAQGKFDGVCPKCLVDSVFGTPFLTTQLEKTAPMPAVGGEFGNYVILGVLGSGGMGVVYKARQKGLERTVALKVLPAGKDAPAELVERFFREARLAAQLQHSNIVPIHEVSSQEGAYFYSMDLVEGTTLSEFLKKRGLASREAVEIVWKIAQAVEYAHEKGVLHRDLKPANVMVDRSGEPKVLDFGIAKSMSTHSGVTTTGSALGTPPYMSPEQAAGAKNLDVRADVYSLGAILYEVLTGRPPHTGETAMEVYRKIATEEPERPSKAPRDLQVICLKALEKDKRHRYESAKALAEDLRRHLDGQRILTRPVRRFSRLIPVGWALVLRSWFFLGLFLVGYLDVATRFRSLFARGDVALPGLTRIFVNSNLTIRVALTLMTLTLMGIALWLGFLGRHRPARFAAAGVWIFAAILCAALIVALMLPLVSLVGGIGTP